MQFCWYYHREIAWNVPINSDQAMYLRNSYDVEQAVKDGGIAALPASMKKLITISANGFGLPADGLIFSFFEDGARLSRLHVNLVAMLILELSAFYTISYLTSSPIWGWASLGLILAQNVAWFWAGGMFDFRPDFVAYCVYGIWICAVLRSEVCLKRGWSLVSAAAVFFLVINRYVAMVYATGVVLSLAAILLILYRRNIGKPEEADPIRARLINLTLASALASALISPFMWMARKAIHDYYIVGHLGEEKLIRMHEAGVYTLSQFLKFYPVNIYATDLQKFFFLVCGVLFIVAVCARLISRWTSDHSPTNPTGNNALAFLRFRIIFLLLSIAIPLAALTADYSKSGVVGSIVCVPIAILLVYLASLVCGQFRSRAAQITMGCGALVVLCMGVGKVADETRTHTTEYRHRDDVLRLVDAAQWVTWTANDRGWREPHVSFDVISGFLCTGILSCEAFEHGGHTVPYQTKLGGDIRSIDKSHAIDSLIDSDFVFLTNKPKFGPYPFYDSMRAMEPEVDTWVQSHFVKGRELDFDGSHVTIYVRPSPATRPIDAATRAE
jgi:hypothetical protein